MGGYLVTSIDYWLRCGGADGSHDNTAASVRRGPDIPISREDAAIKPMRVGANISPLRVHHQLDGANAYA
jgi:hypothetical protein